MPSTPKAPIITADAAIFTLIGTKLVVALARRQEGPFAGQLALPGGPVQIDQRAGRVDGSMSEAMGRILKSQHGIKPSHMEQVCTEAGPDRDPCGWSASVLHLVLLHHEALQGQVETGEIELHEALPKLKVRGLAFDHRRLIALAVDRLQSKAGYSTIVANLLPRVFSLPDLHAAYEAIIGEERNLDSFRRKILKEGALVEEGMIRHTGGKPAQGYRLRESITIVGHQLI